MVNKVKVHALGESLHSGEERWEINENIPSGTYN